MLRKIRIALAAILFVGITLLLTGIGQSWWGWTAKLQLLPSTLRMIADATLGNIAVVALILLVTLLAGRIYCSTVCPLGVMQDLVIWLRRMLGRAFPRWKGLRKRFRFNRSRDILRGAVAALTIAGIITGLQLAVALIEPYSAYGRMIRSLVGGDPAVLPIAAGVTFIVIVTCAWMWGRAWCNNFCPVGTVLGCVSKFQIFGVKVDRDKCIQCGACSRSCKASCIQEGTLEIDYSRCVDCFDCIDSCSQRGISFGRIRRSRADAGEAENGAPDTSRRAFLATGALLLGTAVSATAQNMKLDGGLAPVTPKQPLEREPRIVPPGSGSVSHFYDTCTACQLCVTACPNGVLRPSTDLNHLLQPQMGYEDGFCRPECTACSDVCPTGAILPVKREAKTLIRIGTAVVNPGLCLAATGEEHCGSCARHCPTGAITMVDIDNIRRPVIAESQCIGCGKCEFLCPVRPVSAISVKGLETHIIK